MQQNFLMFMSAFWGVFSFSFLVALTGAMSPGPLLTYTIVKSVQSRRRGYLMGIWIITGHALLEAGIVLLLLLGFSFVLKNILVVRSIGFIGGAILIYFGGGIVRDVLKDRIPTSFLQSSENPAKSADDSPSCLNNPVVGGILVSMANPYWWVWWATIGLAFMVQFEISFQDWTKLAAFFIGHEAGDLIWYLLVSTLAFFGIQRLNKKAYYGILAVCGVFMILFGLYLGAAPFFKAPV